MNFFPKGSPKLFHLAALTVFLLMVVIWYGEKEAQLETCKASHLQKLQATKSDDLPSLMKDNIGIEIVKTGLKTNESKLFIQSQMSQDFASLQSSDSNKTIVKINASLSKKVFPKLHEYAPFIMTTKVKGKDFIVTFLPIHFKSTAINGYLVSYDADNTMVKIEREFSEKVFLLAMFGLLMKAMFMGRSIYRQNKG
ncbi:MAG: hypothetical protein Q8R86_06975 [Sulfuricurvum sp.]|nr:hypothetical protein [Sulfuricurvum sp.]